VHIGKFTIFNGKCGRDVFFHYRNSDYGKNNPIGQLLHTLTEPILGPCRRMLDKSPLGGGMMLDFSPIIALILMRLAEQLIKSAIMLL